MKTNFKTTIEERGSKDKQQKPKEKMAGSFLNYKNFMRSVLGGLRVETVLQLPWVGS